MITVLRLERVKTGKSLREFARVHNFSEVALCRMERGKEYIYPAWREALANALGLAVDQLCDEHGWPRWDAPLAAGKASGNECRLRGSER